MDRFPWHVGPQGCPGSRRGRLTCGRHSRAAACLLTSLRPSSKLRQTAGSNVGSQIMPRCKSNSREARHGQRSPGMNLHWDASWWCGEPGLWDTPLRYVSLQPPATPSKVRGPKGQTTKCSALIALLLHFLLFYCSPPWVAGDEGHERARNSCYPEVSGAWRALNLMPSGTPIGVQMRLRLATGGAPNGDRRLIFEIPIGMGETWVKYSRDPDDPAPPLDSLENVPSTLSWMAEERAPESHPPRPALRRRRL